MSAEAVFSKGPALIKSFLIAGAVRGVDASGMFQLTANGELVSHKLPVCGSLFTQDAVAKDMIADASSSWVTFVHNRSATTGGMGIASAHPMTSYVEDGAVFSLMHNGTLKGWNQTKYVSDTHWAADKIKLGGAAAIKGFDGAYCFVWSDLAANASVINIVRNKERPMHVAFVKNSKTALFASEPGMLFWLAERADVVIEEDTIISLEEDQLYEFNIQNPKAFTKTPLKQVAQNTSSSNGSVINNAQSKTPASSSWAKDNILKEFKAVVNNPTATVILPPASTAVAPNPVSRVQHGADRSDARSTELVVRDGVVAEVTEDAEWDMIWDESQKAFSLVNAEAETKDVVIPFPSPKFLRKNIDLAREAGWLGREIEFSPIMLDPDLNEYLGEVREGGEIYSAVIYNVGSSFTKELDRAQSATCTVIGARENPAFNSRHDDTAFLEFIVSKPTQTVDKRGVIAIYAPVNKESKSGTVRN